MYESPIQIIAKDIQLQMEENICKAVKEVGINVNKEELINALEYDREQYIKGFEDGRADVIDEIDKILLDRFTCDALRADWTNADIRETIHFELEQLKGQKNDV